MSQIKVGVLRGGPSAEYPISLRTGAHILRSLPEKFAPFDIFIDRNGTWHVHGMPLAPEDALRSVDVVVNALHGAYGEDGGVQKTLDMLGARYTGPGVAPAAIAMNKVLAKQTLASFGIQTPEYVTVRSGGNMDAAVTEIFKHISGPWVVKPIAGGSSLGVVIADNFHELGAAVVEALGEVEEVLVEEYIRGREATCGVIDGFRGMNYYPLIPVEIGLPTGKKFFDYDAKYGGEATLHCPGYCSLSEKRRMEKMAIAAHRVLGLRHYSRSDFIVGPRGVYLLETNALPGLTEASLFPAALAAGGISMPEFLGHIVSRAYARK